MTESRQAIDKGVQMRSQIDADLLFEFSSCFRGNTDLLVTCCGGDDVALDYLGMGKKRKEGETSDLLEVESWEHGWEHQKITWLRKPQRPARGNNRQWKEGELETPK